MSRRHGRGHFKNPKRGFRFKLSYLIIAIFLLMAYSYFNSVSWQYGYSIMYGINPIIYWLIVAGICAIIYFKVK